MGRFMFRIHFQTRTMGNGQSRDEFVDVLPSTKVSGSISEAWTSGTSSLDDNQQTVLQGSDGQVPPVKIGKIVPPGHTLQLENTSRLNFEASEVVRAFNNIERTEDRFMIPESVKKSRTLDAYADVCSEILPEFLYVSNLRVARNTTKLRELGITHVINCCGELKFYEDGVEQPATISGEDFNILKLLLRDDANEDLTPFLPKVMEYIAMCRQRSQSQSNKKDKVLVHCHQGVSRSCAFAIAYVMLEQRQSYHEASALVKRQRAISSPNAAFICQLLEWEKDLQAMRFCEKDGFALGGVHRLAPHSAYDPGYFVLKRCYESNGGSARQRQNIANVRTPDDEHRLLWSQGTFVFQSPTTPTDVVVWYGSKCEIPEAVSRATKLTDQLLRVQRLVQPSEDALWQTKIIEVHESSDGHTGTDFDHFGYAGELQWSQEAMPKLPHANSAVSTFGSTDSNQPEVQTTNNLSVPQLFTLEAIGEEGGEDLWDQITNYDSEDLTPDSAFLLCVEKAQGCVQGFVWIGTNCNFTPDDIVKAAQKQIQNLPFSSSSPSLVIEHQNQESDPFWKVFEAGY